MHLDILFLEFPEACAAISSSSYIYETVIFCKRRPLNTESTADIESTAKK